MFRWLNLVPIHVTQVQLMYYWWRGWLDIVGVSQRDNNYRPISFIQRTSNALIKLLRYRKCTVYGMTWECCERWLGKSWLECAQQAPGARFWRTKRAKNVRRVNGAASWGPDLHRPRRNGTRPPLGWYSAVSICYRNHLSTEIPKLWSLNVNLKTTQPP